MRIQSRQLLTTEKEGRCNTRTRTEIVKRMQESACVASLHNVTTTARLISHTPVVRHFVRSGFVLFASKYRCHNVISGASSGRGRDPPTLVPPFSCRRAAPDEAAPLLSSCRATPFAPASSEPNDSERSRARLLDVMLCTHTSRASALIALRL